MPIERTMLIGSGGHAKVVIDALRQQADAGALLLVDESPARLGTTVWGLKVSGLDLAQAVGQQFHICIGANAVRARLFSLLGAAGAQPRTIVHPRASVAHGAVIGAGSFVAAGAIVGPDAVVGAGCVINHGAVVDHDCRIDDFCHIAPGVTLAGNVQVGAGVLVGAGANVLPGVRIGRGATIGAGAVVLADVPENSLYAGVPARKIVK